MPILQIVNGNLLEAEEAVICQQCNCLSRTPFGLAQQIAIKYPWADTYRRRVPQSYHCTKYPSILGSIQVDTLNDKSVIHLFAQYFPAKPGVVSGLYKSAPYQILNVA